ncbi:hypothetical protein KUL42_39170 [Alteromonas sp. KUL42]|nr:hypothetical protein KUL42_39170 [Alteromonas sp. KUL42]
MVHTNLMRMTHSDGRKVKKGEIEVGLEVIYPSPTGGRMKYSCYEVNDSKAKFSPISPDWPKAIWGVTVEFNCDDFSIKEFIELKEAINAYNRWNDTPNDGQRSLVQKAEMYGYAQTLGFCTAGWTERGIERYRELLK